MKLKEYKSTLEHQLWEFDVWVTPTVTDIEDTSRFKDEMESILTVLKAITKDETVDIDETRYSADLTERVLAYLDSSIPADSDSLNRKETALYLFNSLSRLLFLVTGQSDNNHKCQFPLFLRNELDWTDLPGIAKRRSKHTIVYTAIPRVLKSETFMNRVADLYTAAFTCKPSQPELSPKLREQATMLLFEYVACILAEPKRQAQFAAYVHYFIECSSASLDPVLMLTPLVRFQVRGSVAATGGHEPEDILRSRMIEWGLKPNVDFNTIDVVLDIEAGRLIEEAGAADEPVPTKAARAKKTRAFDFVLPYQTRGWTPRIFVQAQFYAGDSGSVSHKNVDQTETSRRNATELVTKTWPQSPSPLFVEYVDGAGYSASLNGDLKSLLSFEDTADFFQIRSAPIRLRRLFQFIGFLTPLEVAHSVVLCNGDASNITETLKAQGYTRAEIKRGLHTTLEQGFISYDGENKYTIADKHFSIIRCYLLLDIIANNGDDFATIKQLKGAVLVPGYGPYYGIKLAELAALVNSKSDNILWPGSMLVTDLSYLCDNGFVILR